MGRPKKERAPLPPIWRTPDELWAEVEPLIPVRQRRRRYPGRKAIPDRLVLNGILHVLHTGIAWEDLPQEYGYGSGVTAWRLDARARGELIELAPGEKRPYELELGALESSRAIEDFDARVRSLLGAARA